MSRFNLDFDPLVPVTSKILDRASMLPSAAPKRRSAPPSILNFDVGVKFSWMDCLVPITAIFKATGRGFRK